MRFARRLIALPLLVLAAATIEARPFQHDGRAYVFSSPNGEHVLRVAWYGPSMVRLQTAHDDEAFLPDGHYEMVESHDWPTDVTTEVTDTRVVLSSPALEVTVDRETLAASFTLSGAAQPALQSRTRLPETG